MATPKLISRLAFRHIKPNTEHVASIAVKYGQGKDPGHAAAR